METRATSITNQPINQSFNQQSFNEEIQS